LNSSPLTTSTELERLLRDAESRFEFEVIKLDHYRPPALRDNVTVHAFTNTDTDDYLDDAAFGSVREWFETNGYFISRQSMKTDPFDGVEHVFISPIEMVNPKLLYHATRTQSLDSIRKNGILCGARQRCTTDRLDPIRNIYGVETLGNAGDKKRNIYGTAHWWREHLALTNRFGDRNWSLLQIDVISHGRLNCYRDIWSNSGIVIRVPSHIDCQFIQVVA
jgi:hypothetical protein